MSTNFIDNNGNTAALPWGGNQAWGGNQTWGGGKLNLITDLKTQSSTYVTDLNANVISNINDLTTPSITAINSLSNPQTISFTDLFAEPIIVPIITGNPIGFLLTLTYA